MCAQPNRRFAIEMSDFPSDRAVALAMWAACLAILIFTGAGKALVAQLAAYVATWGMG